ncbi:MAG: hypothetical protein IKZ49_01125 [Alphaproteobacteria bacterium]|nr:hypothetical protein [Alphaproteobacteria bacterium]
MIIQHYELHSNQELLNIIKNTHLAGDANIKPFIQSDIKIQKARHDDLLPTQRFVLQDQINNINILYSYFLTQGINIANLDGFIVYTTDEDNNTYTLTPPIVEIIENQPLLIDGQHRASFFGKMNMPFNIIQINNVPKQYYPYQLPNKDGWREVLHFEDKLPENFVRKYLRYPDKATKKFMFREYDFPGLIKIAREHTGKTY